MTPTHPGPGIGGRDLPSVTDGAGPVDRSRIEDYLDRLDECFELVTRKADLEYSRDPVSLATDAEYERICDRLAEIESDLAADVSEFDTEDMVDAMRLISER